MKKKRFNVGPLHDECVQKFVSHVTRHLETVWDKKADGQTQWSVIRDCMSQTCNVMLGRDGRKQPWFAAAQSSLQPLISKCNALFSCWLQFGCAVDRQRYLSQRCCLASAVRSSKNQLLQEKAQSIQDAMAQDRPSVVWQDNSCCP